MEWEQQGKTEAFEEKPVRVLLLPQNIDTDGPETKNGHPRREAELLTTSEKVRLFSVQIYWYGHINVLYKYGVISLIYPHTQWVCYNEQMLQRKMFINKIKMLERTQMLQWTRRNTIDRRSTRVRMTCRAFPLRFERHSSTLLSLVKFSYQFSSVICLFVQCIKVK
jgi:hypothetical protein